MNEAIATAIGTDSSAATLPITMKCIRGLDISNEIVQVVLPLGVTLNMNGTAIYVSTSPVLSFALVLCFQNPKIGSIGCYIYCTIAFSASEFWTNDFGGSVGDDCSNGGCRNS
jgi:Na+/H+-dicarboxylate symporter